MLSNKTFFVLSVLGFAIIVFGILGAPFVVSQSNVVGLIVVSESGETKVVPCKIVWGMSTESGMSFRDEFGNYYSFVRGSVEYDVASKVVRGEVSACK